MPVYMVLYAGRYTGWVSLGSMGFMNTRVWVMALSTEDDTPLLATSSIMPPAHCTYTSTEDQFVNWDVDALIRSLGSFFFFT
jgi:hypothetical protein